MPCACWDVPHQSNGQWDIPTWDIPTYQGTWDFPQDSYGTVQLPYALDNLGMIELSPWISVGYPVRLL